MKRMSFMKQVVVITFLCLMVLGSSAQKIQKVDPSYVGNGFFYDINNDGALEALVKGNYKEDNLLWHFPEEISGNDVICWIDRNGLPVKEVNIKENNILYVEDLNNDGEVDIIGSSYGYDENNVWREYVSIYFPDEIGKYQKITTDIQKKDIQNNGCIIDINHDGRKDIFFYRTNGNIIKPVAYIQTADHRFVYEELTVVTDEEELENIDFSSGTDGTFTRNNRTQSLSFKEGMFAHAREFLFDIDEESTSTRRAVQTGSGSSDVNDETMVVDINDDGYPDIITSTHQSLLSLPDGRYFAGTLAGKVTIADINSDGLKDIVLFNSNTNSVMLYLSLEDGGYTEKKLIDNGSITAMYCQDFDGDGLTDIMLQAASESYSFIVFFRNKGNGEFSKKENMLTGYYLFSKPYDMNNDGKVSVLACSMADRGSYTNAYHAHYDIPLRFLTFDNAFKLTEQTLAYEDISLITYWVHNTTIPEYETFFGVSDFDGDGVLDIACQDTEENGYNTYIYSPFSPSPNTAPQQMPAPNVVYDKQSGFVKVEWPAGIDKETASNDLTYTVGMGTAVGKHDLMVYDAGVSRYCVANAGTWPQDKVYVSVRAMDANGKQGEWSPSASFNVETQSAEFTLRNLDEKANFYTTADTILVRSLNGRQLTYTLPDDGKIIFQKADSAYIMFSNYGEKTIEASFEGGNNVMHKVKVLPLKYKKIVEIRQSSNYNVIDKISSIDAVFDLNADGKTEGIMSSIWTFEDGMYSRLGTMFNSDITQFEGPLFVDKTMDGQPDIYSKYITKNGTNYNWLINQGDLDFEAEQGRIDDGSSTGYGKFIDLNNDGFMEYINGSNIYFNNGDYTFKQLNTGDINLSSRIPFADIDRDGLIEYVSIENNTDTKSKQEYPRILKIRRMNNNGELVLIKEYKKKNGYPLQNWNTIFYDVNHDGFEDIVWSERESDTYNGYAISETYKGYAMLGSADMDFSQQIELPGRLFQTDLDNNGYIDFLSNVGNYPYHATIIMGDEKGGSMMEQLSSSWKQKSWWIDYENDTDNDGKPGTYQSAYTNEAPTAPTAVIVTQDNDYVVVSWSGATDKETPNIALRYNLSVKEKGKTGNGSYIISPLNMTKNEAKAIDTGTLQYRYATRFPIPFTRFEVGKTYEVQLQTIDGWCSHSPFSEVVEFTPDAKVMLTMPEKAGVGQAVKFTLNANSEENPTLEIDGGIKNGNTITWQTAGVKTVKATANGVTTSRQIRIINIPDLTINLPQRVLSGSVVQFNLPTGFFSADATVKLTGSKELSYSVENGKGIVVMPKKKGQYNVQIEYTDAVFGKIVEKQVLEVVDFVPELSYVSATNDGCLLQWAKDMGSEISSILTGKVKIYRETAITDRYEVIGEAAIADGQFIDQTARPDVKSCRYIVSLPTTYGTESQSSNVFATVLLMANLGIGNNINLHWNNYIGSSVATYTIYSGTSRDNLQVIDEVSGNTLSYVHHRTSDVPTFYAIGYKLMSELANASPMLRTSITEQPNSNIICSDEAYNVLMVQNISVYEKDGHSELNKDCPLLHMQAVLTPVLATLARVEWSIAAGSELAEIDQNGILRIKENSTGGIVTVMARAIDGSEVFDNMNITVDAYQVTAVNDISKDRTPTIRFSNNGIYIENVYKAMDVRVITLSGSIYCQRRITSDSYIPLTSGVYIIKVGNAIRKLSVK